MEFSLREWLIGKLARNPTENSLTIEELNKYAEEIQIRELAFNVCVNMIANAVGKCEIKTYKGGEPIEEAEYYLWNVEPNINQNSSAFLHKLIDTLYRKNEVLIIAEKTGSKETLEVADDCLKEPYTPGLLRAYKNVRVGEKIYNKTFYENEIMHLKLNNSDVKKVIDSLYQSYYKLIYSSIQNYNWNSGKHLKVHVDQMIQGDEGFIERFSEIIEKQVKPWFNSQNSVLPEFDGYSYTDQSTAETKKNTTRDIRSLIDDVFSFTANAFGIPPVLLLGNVESTKSAMSRWLTTCIDPLCDQIEEEITRKRYGYANWSKGNFVEIDTSKMQHFDMFENAGNIEKLVGSGAYSVNDVRTAAGQPEIREDWADAHWLTKNIATIQEAARAEITKGGE